MPISWKGLAESVLANAIWWVCTLVLGGAVALWRLLKGRKKLLEVVITKYDPQSESDWAALIPEFSSPSPKSAADRTKLDAHLSDVTVINHDDKPTEVLRLQVAVLSWWGREVKPVMVREDKLVGNRRMEARHAQRFQVDFDAAFEGQFRRERVFLVLKATGHRELRTKLPDAFFFSTQTPNGP